MNAIVEIAGQQYNVEAGQELHVKRRKGYKVKNGFRPSYTRIKIDNIIA